MKTQRTKIWLLEGEGIVMELGEVMYTLLYSKWITNKDLLHSTQNSAQGYVAAWMGAEFGGEWIHVYVRSGHPRARPRSAATITLLRNLENQSPADGFPYHDSRAMTRSPSPWAWTPDFPGAT